MTWKFVLVDLNLSFFICDNGSIGQDWMKPMFLKFLVMFRKDLVSVCL